MRMYLSSSGQKGDPNTLTQYSEVLLLFLAYRRTFHLYNEHTTRLQEALLKFKVNGEQKVTDVAIRSKIIKK